MVTAAGAIQSLHATKQACWELRREKPGTVGIAQAAAGCNVYSQSRKQGACDVLHEEQQQSRVCPAGNSEQTRAGQGKACCAPSQQAAARYAVHCRASMVAVLQQRLVLMTEAQTMHVLQLTRTLWLDAATKLAKPHMKDQDIMQNNINSKRLEDFDTTPIKH